MVAEKKIPEAEIIEYFHKYLQEHPNVSRDEAKNATLLWVKHTHKRTFSSTDENAFEDYEEFIKNDLELEYEEFLDLL